MADEFSKYHRTGKTTIEKIKDFFARLLARLKMLFSRKSEVLKMFENVKESLKNVPDTSEAVAPKYFEESQKTIEELRSELTKTQGLLDVAVSNQDQPQFRFKIPALKTEIQNIRDQIKELKFPKAATAKEALANAEKRVGTKTTDIKTLQNQLAREKLSLAAHNEMPEAHIKAYGRDKSVEYKARIAELEQKIEKAIPELQAPKIRVSGRNIEIPKEIAERQVQLELRKELVDNSPLKDLLKYVAKSGDFKGRLPEVLGKTKADLADSKSYRRIKDKNVLDFIKRGDSIVQGVFGAGSTYEAAPEVEQVREDMDKYLKEKQDLKLEQRAVNTEIKDFIAKERDRIATERISKEGAEKTEQALTKSEIIAQRIQESQSLQDWKSIVQTYAHEVSLPKSVDEVVPPKARGGIKSPKLDLLKANDNGWMARDSIDRNIEKTFIRKDAVKLNEFLTDTFRKNATREVEIVQKYLKPLSDKMKELGIKPGSNEEALVQLFGEGLITMDELMQASPTKWSEVDKAVSFFKDFYDKALNDWNAERPKYDYLEVPKRSNYFAHADEVSFWTKNYGILNKADDLPTSIAGGTKFFKPGKVFSRHELPRTGRKTKYAAIANAKIYIKSIAKQIVSMDNLAHARAVEKYIEKAAKTGERLGTPLHLQRFQTNFKNIIQNQLGGKMGGLDREIEENGDRKVVNSIMTLTKLIGKNIIAFNTSIFFTHLVSLPLNASTVDKVDFIKGLFTTISSPFFREGGQAIPYYMIDGQRSDLLYRRYPKEYLKTKFETVDEAGGWLVKTSDIFKTRTAVASKYYELIKQGIDPKEAIRQADIYAGHIVGDYSRGLKPNLLSQKIFKTLAQFQFGMNDGISVLLHDIPYGSRVVKDGVIEMKKNKDGTYSQKEKTNLVKMWWKLAQWTVFAYLMNEFFFKKIKGSGKGLDPIGLILTLAGLNEEGRGKSFGTRAGATAKDLAGELPFTNVLTGNLPIASALSQPFKDLFAGKYLKSGEDVLSMFVSPFGGGLQAKKTFEGIKAYKQGYATSATGAPTFPVKKGLGSAAQTILFGSTGTPAAQAYYSSQGAKSPITNTLNEIRQLKSEGKTDEAQAILDNLSADDLKSLKGALSSEKAQKTKQRELELIPTVQKIKKLKAAGDLAGAQKLLDSVPEADQAALAGAAKMLKTATTKTEQTFGAGTSTWDHQSFITHIANIAKASTLHPIQYFAKVFDGAGDWRVTGFKNGTVIVNRMPETASQAIRQAEGKDTSDWRLDHTVPLEAGGGNTKTNLQLIPTEEWKTNTPVENLIASKLISGAISGKQAKEFAIRFKAGQGETLSPEYEDLYKTKYNSTPITAEEIQSY